MTKEQYVLHKVKQLIKYYGNENCTIKPIVLESYIKQSELDYDNGDIFEILDEN